MDILHVRSGLFQKQVQGTLRNILIFLLDHLENPTLQRCFILRGKLHCAAIRLHSLKQLASLVHLGLHEKEIHTFRRAFQILCHLLSTRLKQSAVFNQNQSPVCKKWHRLCLINHFAHRKVLAFIITEIHGVITNHRFLQLVLILFA